MPWLNRQLLITLAVIVSVAVVLTSFAWSDHRNQLEGFAGEQENRLPDEQSEIIAVENTPLPDELLANREQTNGIVLGSIVLVLIVIGGTLSVITQRTNNTT